jgi:MoaA/NifB/PqqE/SkfB family radical SAM enzyme
MSGQSLQLLAMLFDPRVTAAPIRVLRELRRRGIQRLPDELHRRLDRSDVRNPSFLRFARRWLDGERISRHRGQWVINSFLPPFPGRAYDRLFENLLSGRHLSPVSAFLAITGECPCHCAHCSAARDRQAELSKADWENVIRQLHGLGASIIGFTGGEPLLRPDVRDLVLAAAGGGAATILFTTGIGFDPGTAAALRQAGLWAVCVSLDHVDAAQYDRQRGRPGLWDTAVAAIRLARRTGFYTMVSTVATPQVVRDRVHERIYRLARELRVDEYRLVEPMPCGRLVDAVEADLLTPEDVLTLRRFHVETNRRGRLPKVCAFNQIESPELFGCGAGTQLLYIDAAGRVCPCDFTPLSFGNAVTEPLADIWRKMNLAMGDSPRTHCFVQRHFRAIREKAALGLPLPPTVSENICRALGPEPLPGYFACIVQGGHRQEEKTP